MSDLQSQDVVKAVPALTRFKFIVLRRFLWLLAMCFSINGLYRLGQAFGICEWAINYKRRRRFHQRMKQIFGNEYDRSKMRSACRRYFMRTRCDKIYYLLFDLLPEDEILRRTQFTTKSNVDSALARGNGVYFAVSHFGAHHVAATLVCFLGYQMAGVRDRNEGPLRRYIQQRLARRSGRFRAPKMFFADSFPRELYRWFQSNGVLGSALDVDRARKPHLRRSAIQLFGETREFLTGTMQIALRCRATIHAAFVVSQPNFHYQVIVSPPLIDPDCAEDSPETLQLIMQKYAGQVEEHARKYPDNVSRV